MKKGMILKRHDSKDLDLRDIKTFQDYARNNDVDISGMIKYPIELTVLDPEGFANVLKQLEQDVFLVNDDDIVISDIMHEGKLFEILDNNDITIIHAGEDMELKDYYSLYPEDMLEQVKKQAHERNMNNKSYRIALISSHEIDIESEDSLKCFLSEHRIQKKLFINMNAFHELMKTDLDNAFKLNDINIIIVLDDELMTPSFQNYMEELKSQNNIEVKYKDDLQREMEHAFEMQGMHIN